MSYPLPPGFASIATAMLAPDQSFHSVIGIAMRPGEDPVMTRRGEYMVTFALADPAYVHQQADMRGVMIRFFRSNINDIPLPHVGDVVVLRDVKKVSFHGTPVLLSHHSTSICMFAAFDVPDPGYAIKYMTGEQTLQCVRIPNHKHVTVPEQLYAISLKNDMANRHPLNPPANAPNGPRSHTTPVVHDAIAGPSRSVNTTGAASRESGAMPRAQSAAIPNRKFSLIKDLTPNKFSDLVVEVIKIFSGQGGGFVELQVSDYTEHQMLYNHAAPEESLDDAGADGDSYNYLQQPRKEWPGPYGQRVLGMEIHYPHAAFINNSVKEGDFIHIRNARAKIGQSNKLEANLWTDSRWPDKIDVSICRPGNSVECEALVGRRTQYWDARPKNVDANDTSSKSNARKKAKAKKAKQKKQESITSAKQMLGAKIGSGNVTNPNVRCASGTIQLSSLADTIAMKGSSKDTNNNEFELPFVNQKRRARVRVIDYYPKALEDFSYFVETYEHDTQNSAESDWQPHYEWDFFLRLEDAPEHIVRGVERATMWVHVTNESAQYLLKADAVNLRPNEVDLTTEDVQPLTALEEKLFLLWGNLKEVVTAEPGQNLVLQNPPFECCIREFGQELDDADRADQNRREWIRIYEMFGVTIN